jgi:hypothetical protein
MQMIVIMSSKMIHININDFLIFLLFFNINMFILKMNKTE